MGDLSRGTAQVLTPGVFILHLGAMSRRVSEFEKGRHTPYTIANDESEFATDDRLDASLFASTTTTLARHNRHKRYKQQSTDNQTEAYRMCSGNQLWWKGEWAEMAEGIHF